jgi:hypothetical protein
MVEVKVYFLNPAIIARARKRKANPVRPDMKSINVIKTMTGWSRIENF